MPLRGVMVRASIAGLCVAALAAIAALVTGDFGDTHERIVGTSLGFSFFCALGASGDALRVQSAGRRATAGAVASALAALAFVLLVLVIWADDSDVLWRAWGVSAITALWASHWSLVLRARRRGDSSTVRFMVLSSIVAATIDMLVGNIWSAGIVEDVSDGGVRALGVVLVVTVLTTALPPIMRRLAAAPPPPDAFGRRLTIGELADEVNAVAGRLERAQTASEARREAAALRQLADRARG